jgi:hypothetical protein
VPTEPTTMPFKGIDWKIRPMGKEEIFFVPETVYHRMKAAEA